MSGQIRNWQFLNLLAKEGQLGRLDCVPDWLCEMQPKALTTISQAEADRLGLLHEEFLRLADLKRWLLSDKSDEDE